MIAPIDTRYQGYLFRSRTEARWAVFMDAMGVRWEYEKEGFKFDGKMYLPDFWLPHLKVFVEIKPGAMRDDPNNPEYIRAHILQSLMAPTIPVHVIYGNPWPDEHAIEMNSGEGNPFALAECRKCGGLNFINADDSWGELHDCIGDSEKTPMRDGRKLMAAFAAARGARFEHEDQERYQ